MDNWPGRSQGRGILFLWSRQTFFKLWYEGPEKDPMNKNGEYLSIKDFADRAGLSRQTVYNKLDTILHKHVKVVKGHKAINSNALKLFDVKEFDNSVKDNLTDLTTDFTEIFSVLKDQLRVKDEQLKDQAEKSNKEIDYL